MKKIFLVLILIQFNVLTAQEALYVAAENGLIVRDGPGKTYGRVGKLDYAEKLTSFQDTRRADEVVDDGEVIQGSWYHINGSDSNNEPIEGYVFSGFLTVDELKKKTKIKFENFTIEFEHIALWENEKMPSPIQGDIVVLSCDLVGSPEDKKVKIKNTTLKKIELYQRFENSITIMDEGPHCDLIHWKHYYSHWEKIPFLAKENAFKTLKYTEEDKKKFIPVEVDELKNTTEERCGERWSKLLTEIKDVGEYPTGVSTSKIFIKIVTTDTDDTVSEKILEFSIPMGC